MSGINNLTIPELLPAFSAIFGEAACLKIAASTEFQRREFDNDDFAKVRSGSRARNNGAPAGFMARTSFISRGANCEINVPCRLRSRRRCRAADSVSPRHRCREPADVEGFALQAAVASPADVAAPH